MFTIPFIALTSDFNPRSPHGERLRAWNACYEKKKFQSTLPARGATFPRKGRNEDGRFQSTLPARGATDTLLADADVEEISIHAPRTGSDTQSARRILTRCPFQSTLPARGATVPLSARTPGVRGFQSTLPARGATFWKPFARNDILFQSTLPARGATCICKCIRPRKHFNPRSPHGERRQLATELGNVEAISIHAPRTGSDIPARSVHRLSGLFQSTLPARGATPFSFGFFKHGTFQSTLPARGATSFGGSPMW